MGFSFDPGEHSLQVSAKSIEGSDCCLEWVKHLLQFGLEGYSSFKRLPSNDLAAYSRMDSFDLLVLF
jgi:hypothetical protein